MPQNRIDTSEKALKINLDQSIYGTFAEIGAGQEVARKFFQVGGAAGTVAKTMSAYDMKFSDAIYGTSSRYVAKSRLRSMLDHEYELLIERLGADRGKDTRFFTFANTVAARSFRGGNACHGWVGVRFQHEAGAEPSDIVVHIRLHDKTNMQQQQAVGVFGVNFIYGAFHYLEDQELFIKSLVESLAPDEIEVDMIEFMGPAFRQVDSRLMSLRLVEYGLTEAIMFGSDRKVRETSDTFYKRPVILQRGSFKPITNVNLEMHRLTKEVFLEALDEDQKEPINLLEISIKDLLRSGELNEREFLDLADTLCTEGFYVLMSDYPEYYRLIRYLRQRTNQPIAVSLGVNSLVHIFSERYYENLQGGVLEAFGSLFSMGVRHYVYPMPRDLYEIFLLSTDPSTSCLPIPDEELITANNILVPDHVKYLYMHLRSQHRIVPIEPSKDNFSDKLPTDIIAMMRKGDPSWENYVPEKAAALIRKRKMFGLKE